MTGAFIVRPCACRRGRPARWHIGVDAGAVGAEGCGEIIDDRGKRCLTGATLQNFRGDRIGFEDALRREEEPFVARVVVF